MKTSNKRELLSAYLNGQISKVELSQAAKAPICIRAIAFNSPTGPIQPDDVVSVDTLAADHSREKKEIRYSEYLQLKADYPKAAAPPILHFVKTPPFPFDDDE